VPPFVSTFTNKLDAKGRVSIPAPYRQILAQQEMGTLYCIPSFVSASLEAFGNTLLNQFQQRLDKYDPLFSENYDDEAQAVLAAARLHGGDHGQHVRGAQVLVGPNAVERHAGEPPVTRATDGKIDLPEAGNLLQRCATDCESSACGNEDGDDAAAASLPTHTGTALQIPDQGLAAFRAAAPMPTVTS